MCIFFETSKDQAQLERSIISLLSQYFLFIFHAAMDIPRKWSWNQSSRINSLKKTWLLKKKEYVMHKLLYIMLIYYLVSRQ